MAGDSVHPLVAVSYAQNLLRNFYFRIISFPLPQNIKNSFSWHNCVCVCVLVLGCECTHAVCARQFGKFVNSSSHFYSNSVESSSSTKMNCCCWWIVLLCYGLVGCDWTTANATQHDDFQKMPKVMFVMLFRNKGITMPFVLNYISQLDYPKDRISFWFVHCHPFISASPSFRSI